MAPKKKVRNLTKFVHGDEPLVQNADKMQTIHLLNWYAAVSQPEDRVSWAESYLKARGLNKYIDAVRKNERFLVPTGLHLMRALDHGTTFKDQDSVVKLIQKTYSQALTMSEEKDLESKSLMLAKKNQEGAQFWSVQDLVDGIFTGTNLIPDRPNVHLTGAMKDHFRSQLDELEAIPNDADLQEAYADIPDDRVMAAKEFLTDLLKREVKQKEVKVKPVRAKRVIPPMKKVAHLKFLREWEGFYSVPTTKIVDAKTLITYNTNGKRLSIFKSTNGFDVKGNKILGWDSCVSRSVRKPLEVLAAIRDTTPIGAERVFESLKTVIRKGYAPMRPTVLILKAK